MQIQRLRLITHDIIKVWHFCTLGRWTYQFYSYPCDLIPHSS